ncbi:hypothetical protein X759_29330 [Mesorhizobium sp. LSHC420B00]|nr:hypothetical protein X759_29330 [Mesorhizobium sp. LSHC420B00]
MIAAALAPVPARSHAISPLADKAKVRLDT